VPSPLLLRRPGSRPRHNRGAGNRHNLTSERPPRVLFVTSEITDFVKMGGLGEVSAAMPRALRQTHDVRVLIPGYRQVLERADITEVADLPALAGLPDCGIGRIDMPDGLVIYVLLEPDLYDRDGAPYGDGSGKDWVDNDVRFARFSLAAAEIACGVADSAGSRTSCTSTTGRPRWRRRIFHGGRAQCRAC
jgi:hypothetical protein